MTVLGALVCMTYPDRCDCFLTSVYKWGLWGLCHCSQNLSVLFWRLHGWLINVLSVNILTKTERDYISSEVRKPSQSSVTEVKENIYKYSERKWYSIHVQVLYLLGYYQEKKKVKFNWCF